MMKKRCIISSLCYPTRSQPILDAVTRPYKILSPMIVKTVGTLGLNVMDSKDIELSGELASKAGKVTK